MDKENLSHTERFGSFNPQHKGRTLDDKQLLEEMGLPEWYKCPFCESIQINRTEEYKTKDGRIWCVFKCKGCNKYFNEKFFNDEYLDADIRKLNNFDFISGKIVINTNRPKRYMCKSCDEGIITKAGKCKTMYLGIKQRYRCNNCRKSFTKKDEFYKMKTPIVVLDYIKNNANKSMRKLNNNIKKRFGYNLSHVSISNYIKKNNLRKDNYIIYTQKRKNTFCDVKLPIKNVVNCEALTK